MFSTAITLRPNGSMTLPKKIRDEFPTAHFIVMKVEGGVFLRPVREEIEYYAKDNGTVGLHFPYGIEAGKLADMFEETIEKIDKGERVKKRKISPRKRRHG
ncbi:hypothetical protein HYS30_01905 [Candidatus Peregrinibacteria bacterium]|nr:hypothetical protein [Candidatus Peregrinibacteria bacterium]